MRVAEAFFATDWFAAFSVQLEPPSREYSTKKYAVVLAELELAKVNVEVLAPLEQLPSDCEAEGSIYGQSIVSLFAVVALSLKVPLVDDV